MFDLQLLILVFEILLLQDRLGANYISEEESKWLLSIFGYEKVKFEKPKWRHWFPESPLRDLLSLKRKIWQRNERAAKNVLKRLHQGFEIGKWGKKIIKREQNNQLNYLKYKIQHSGPKTKLKLEKELAEAEKNFADQEERSKEILKRNLDKNVKLNISLFGIYKISGIEEVKKEIKEI